MVERKVKPDGTVREYPCELVFRGPGVAVVRFVMDRGGEVFDTPIRIPPGSVSDGWFWTARHYNLYRMRGPDGEPLAHRFDAVSAVAIGEDAVTYRDLALDWWVTGDGALIEEDRQEFDEFVRDGLLSAADARAADEASRIVLSRYRHIVDDVALLERRLGLAGR